VENMKKKLWSYTILKQVETLIETEKKMFTVTHSLYPPLGCTHAESFWRHSSIALTIMFQAMPNIQQVYTA